MSNSSDVTNLIIASKLFYNYSVYVIVGLGLTGNLLNILVFTNLKIFHLNHCAFYLIVESMVDIGQLSQVFTGVMLGLSTNGVDPANVSLAWCKLQIVIGQWCRLMLCSIVCFSAIDQYMSTNPVLYLRQLSSLKLSRHQICIASSLCLLHIVPFAIFLQINPLFGCITANTGLTNYYSYFFYPVLSGLLPILTSSLFSLLAYRNVRRIVRRQIPMNRRRLDQQLTAMIFVRVIFFVLLQLPFTIHRIISLKVTIIPGNMTAYVINLWVRLVSTVIIVLCHAANFYIFITTSSRYRRQVKYFLMKKCWQSLKQMCCGRGNVVHPTTIDSAAELD